MVNQSMENKTCECSNNLLQKINQVQEFINGKLLDINKAECSRINGEKERIKNENSRKEAETKRVTNEEARQDGYTKFSRLEDQYASNEKDRQINELERINYETTREHNETYRKDTELSRQEFEKSRQLEENKRVASEIIRVNNENLRQSAEIARVEAEKTREENCATAIANANEVASNPTYVGKDNYVYQYDRTLKTYVKTQVYVKGDAGINSFIIAITWNKLKALRDSGGLQTGLQYCITDYQCATSQTDTKSAGHQFDIIVTAISSSVLSEKASAVLHNGDTYFINSKLQSWQLWYCLDNDATRFVWADTTNGKGVIYRMIDEFGNDCPYDFKNIQFKRYNITGVKNSKSQYVGIGTYLGIKSDLLTINSDSYIWAYTFCGIPQQSGEDATKYEDGDTPKLDTSNIVDLSLNQYSTYYMYSEDYNCYNNIINSCKELYSDRISIIDKNIPYVLPDTVFLSQVQIVDAVMKNRFIIYGFHDNKLSGYCKHISIGCKSYFNTFEGSVKQCVFVENLHNNIVTGTMTNNIFADTIENNSFNGKIENNIFNMFIRYNKFIGECQDNNFIGEVQNCTINQLYSCTFNKSILQSVFSDVESCTFKSYVSYCLFEGRCTGCIFPEDSDKSLQYIRQCGEIEASGQATITVTLDSKKEQIITYDSIANDPLAP